MGVEVYLNFDGNCREAVEFYAKAFKTEEPIIHTFGEAHSEEENFQVPENAKNRIMNAQLTIAGSRVMFSDTWPGSPFTMGNNISITVISSDEAYLRDSFHALKQGGTINMELQETFWSKCYGNVTDKFGVEWQFSHDPNATVM